MRAEAVHPVSVFVKGGKKGDTYCEPSEMSRSTVLMGAMTMNGILCLAASTAALYVPIWLQKKKTDKKEERLVQSNFLEWLDLRKLTLFAVSPFFAILSAPTATLQNTRIF